MDVIQSLIAAVFSNGEAALLGLACTAALLSLTSGLIWSRQWYLLPVSLGLLGLAGFLVNPLADSRSSLDLRQMLLGPDTLLAACVLQIVLAVACFAVGLQIVAHPKSERWKLVLASLCCVPQPVVVLSMLLSEQHWLSAQFGSRPEWVGTIVPLIVLLAVVFIGAICWAIRPTWLIWLQLVTSLLLGTTSALFATTANSLPLGNQTELATHALKALGPAVLVAAVCVAIGMIWERLATSRPTAQRIAHLDTGKS
ncbi:hypothetical protein [Blastopirellula marina]|uniref:hypothetical protein n=1 Tax=Blastopirellula marina TaxID=124 RepID=UPI001304C75C|nr:hypothetical protein [Blastopirellula marina]